MKDESRPCENPFWHAFLQECLPDPTATSQTANVLTEQPRATAVLFGPVPLCNE
jgi:hypothetical protein